VLKTVRPRVWLMLRLMTSARPILRFFPIFSRHAVEHNDRVIDRITRDGQKRGHDQKVDLAARNDREPEGHEDVMQERDDARGREPEVLEPDAHINEDARQREEDRPQRALAQGLPYDRPDLLDTERLDLVPRKCPGKGHLDLLIRVLAGTHDHILGVLVELLDDRILDIVSLDAYGWLRQKRPSGTVFLNLPAAKSSRRPFPSW